MRVITCAAAHGHRAPTPLRFCIRLTPIAATVALTFALPAGAATIVVNNSTIGNAPGFCTLIDAVNAVNLQSAVDGCAGGDGNNDTIDVSAFAPPASGFNFTFPPGGDGGLVLTRAVTIDGGSGAPVVLQRDPAAISFRLIKSSTTLVLNHLAIRGGITSDYAGGGIFVSGGSLTLNGCTVTGNHASGVSGGGIGAYGPVVLNASTVSSNSVSASGSTSANGGGISSSSTVTLTNSTVSGNWVAGSSGTMAGGGIFAYSYHATSTVTNSTISGNHVSATTGKANGGGIATSNFGTVSATNATISGNTASASTSSSGGGIYTYHVALNFCTIADNSAATAQKGGGVFFAFNAAGSANATLLYNNSGGDINSMGPFTLNGSNNLIGTHGAEVTLANAALTCAPHLGPLFNNGGPTLTRPLFGGSCAIDAGPVSTAVATDQRGLTRVVGLASDIGAFENQGAGDPPELLFVDGFEP